MQYSKNLANVPPSSGGVLPDPLDVRNLVVQQTFLNNGTTDLVGDVNMGANLLVLQTTTTNGLSVTGNISGLGDLNLSGAANIVGDLNVSGNTRLGGTFDVASSSTFSNVTIRGTTTICGGNVSISGAGNLTITKPTTVDNAFAVNGSFSQSGAVIITGSTAVLGPVNVEGILSVSGVPVLTNVSGWANAPAVTNVNLNGFYLRSSTGNVGILGATNVSGALTVSGVPVLTNISGWANAPAVTNVNLSGFYLTSSTGNVEISGATNVSGAFTVSGVPLLTNVSGWANASAATNVNLSGFYLTSSTGNVGISGATNISGTLTVLNNLSVGTINSFTYPYGYVFGTGILRVDLCGNDSSGASSKYVYPFRTISAALVNASSGDEVLVNPGTYTQNTGLTVPAGVSIRGANTNSVVIEKLNATTSFTLFEMSSNTRLEDATLLLSTSPTLTSNAHYALVTVSGENILTTTLRSLVLTASCTNAGGNVYGVWATGNSANTSVAVSSEILRGCTVNINASGLRSTDGGSNARCIYSTGSNRLTTRDTNCFITGTNCSGARLFGCETTVSGSYMDLQSSTISASGSLLTNCSVAEISQTHDNSIITLGYTNLLYHSANGKGFETTQTMANYIFGFFSPSNITSGTGGANAIGGSNFYLLSGTMPFQTIVDNNALAAVPYTVAQSAVMHDIIFRVNTNTNLDTNVLHMNIFRNSVVTPVLTLSLTGVTNIVTVPNTSFTVQTGDTVYINLSFSSNSATLTNFRSCTVDFGLL